MMVCVFMLNSSNQSLTRASLLPNDLDVKYFCMEVGTAGSFSSTFDSPLLEAMLLESSVLEQWPLENAQSDRHWCEEV